MFDFSLAFRLSIRTFSLRRKSLRFAGVKRILMTLLIFPFFLCLIISNRFFMMLDWIFFPGFRKMKLQKPVFIVGVPRSATTFLLSIMAADKERFTGFKLWEILFAPSVIQKYFLLGIIAVDRKIGRPLYRLSLGMDKLFLGKITKIHETGLSKPEEDEMLFLFAFSSMYFIFFFPEVKQLDPILFFDELMPQKKRQKLMLYYKRCLQRHVYVFDRKEEKTFLSKNPCFISKTASIAETFPDARLIYMLRSPLRTIPSTISLNANLYAIFSNYKEKNPLTADTTEAVTHWYEMAEKSMRENWGGKNLVVPFRQITKLPKETVDGIYEFLQLVPGNGMQERLNLEQDRVKSYKSGHKYDDHAGLENEVLMKRLDFIFEGKYKDQI